MRKCPNCGANIQEYCLLCAIGTLSKFLYFWDGDTIIKANDNGSWRFNREFRRWLIVTGAPTLKHYKRFPTTFPRIKLAKAKTLFPEAFK